MSLHKGEGGDKVRKGEGGEDFGCQAALYYLAPPRGLYLGQFSSNARDHSAQARSSLTCDLLGVLVDRDLDAALRLSFV